VDEEDEEYAVEETSDFGLHLGEERSSCLSDVSSRSISSEWYNILSFIVRL